MGKYRRKKTPTSAIIIMVVIFGLAGLNAWAPQAFPYILGGIVVLLIGGYIYMTKH